MWDSTLKSHQRAVLDLIDATKPQLIVGPPPCSWFSRVMQLNWPSMARHRRRQLMKEARTLLSFACTVHKRQHSQGRLFIHEHPSTANSWSEQSIQDVLKLPGVRKVTLDMCCFGLTTQTPNGEELVRKTTCLLTNSGIIAKHIEKAMQGRPLTCAFDWRKQVQQSRYIYASFLQSYC